MPANSSTVTDFNPRSPCGERLAATQRRSTVTRRFQSTLPVWGATAGDKIFVDTIHGISIHAPRVGSDQRPYSLTTFGSSFQSTLPVWGATYGADGIIAPLLFQSTLPVWGATSITRDGLLISSCISIHAPRVGSDVKMSALCTASTHFNPRSPCGERLGYVVRQFFCVYFNPRSPCGERPHSIPDACCKRKHFNPRSPCGERLCSKRYISSNSEFQSTLPVWGATSIKKEGITMTKISIHAPRVGSDLVLPVSG